MWKKFLKYLIQNPGSLFVLLFIVLLISCAFLMIDGKEDVAEHVANCAFLFLVIGVIIKLFETRKDKDGDMI